MYGDSKSMTFYFNNLDYKRISVARERRSFTKKALAEKINKTTSAISQFESGKSGLDFETFLDLVRELKVHPAYLTTTIGSAPEIEFSRCHFRANRAVSQIERFEAKEYARDVLRIYNALEKRGIKFPDISVETYEGKLLSEQEVDSFALRTRERFGLAYGPIHDMAQLMEALGVKIILLPEQSVKLDAFATWLPDEKPCIMVARGLPASRMQFSLGHELGHLILHYDTDSGDPLVERIANRFASAFLMPVNTFSKECPRRYTSALFMEVKKHWHVSVSAALFRARQLNIISEGSYKWAMIDLTRKGIRIDEPEEFAPPMPTMMQQALKLLKDELSLQALADELGFFLAELKDILRVQNVSEDLLELMTPKPTNKRSKVLPFNNKVTLENF